MTLEETAIAVAPIAVGWLILHVLFRFTAPSNLDGPTKAYWATAIVSCIHSYIICPLAWEAMKPLWASTDLELATTTSTLVCHVYVAYIVADLVPLVYYGIFSSHKAWAGSFSYIMHHILSILCWGMMAVRGHCHGVACGLLLLECTATFTNGRWILATLGGSWKDGTLYVVNGALMAVTFFFSRVLMMGWLAFHYFFELREQFFALPVSTTGIILASYCFGYPLQLFWFYKIAKGLARALSGGSKPQKKTA
jgi:hypothetical protein